jgi:SAM-dependent methyltransferase
MSDQSTPPRNIGFLNASPAYQKFVWDLLERESFNARQVETAIADADEMFHAAIVPSYPGNLGLALFKYFESAVRIYAVHAQIAAHLGGYPRLGSVLDFGSGYGRLTRLLLQRLPANAITVSDIYADAVAWQRESFGVKGIVSVSDPAAFPSHEKYAIVFAGSVFTHLPPDLFHRWLATLYDLLEPKGILAFSVLDQTWLQAGEQVNEEGYAYFQRSESASLDTGIYGAMYVTEDYLRRAVSRLNLQGPAQVRRVPKALYENQDLYIVAGREVDLSCLNLRVMPLSGTNGAAADEHGMHLFGWAIDFNEGHRIESAKLFKGSEELAVQTQFSKNPEAARYFPAAPNEPIKWQFSPVAGVNPGSMLRVELRSSCGLAANSYLVAPAPGDTSAART